MENRSSPEQESQERLRRAFRVEETPREAPVKDDWRKLLQNMQALAGTPGETYLTGRGIPVEVAVAAGVRYAPDWYGRAAVIFPLRNHVGKLVAAAGRYLDGEKPKARSAGPKKRGAFATVGAWEAEVVLLVEGPADALSLAVCGYPAIAMFGCDLSDAAAVGCAMRVVAVATDADDAGDSAAQKMMAALAARGARVTRLRPPNGRDWNDMLLSLGIDGLKAELDRALGGFREPEFTLAPEWTPEEQIVWDETRRQMMAVLSDADLIQYTESFGAQLFLDPAGKLRVENPTVVPPEVKDEVRGRVKMLTARLRRMAQEEGDAI